MERLNVVDEYNELSRKTARLFSYMSDTVLADFYFKIDDDVGEHRSVCVRLCVRVDEWIVCFGEQCCLHVGLAVLRG